MSLRVRVDRHRCVGVGNCITIAPTAFDWHKGDFLKADVVDVDSVDEEVLHEARLACPTLAIEIEEVQELRDRHRRVAGVRLHSFQCHQAEHQRVPLVLPER